MFVPFLMAMANEIHSAVISESGSDDGPQCPSHASDRSESAATPPQPDSPVPPSDQTEAEVEALTVTAADASTDIPVTVAEPCIDPVCYIESLIVIYRCPSHTDHHRRNRTINNRISSTKRRDARCLTRMLAVIMFY